MRSERHLLFRNEARGRLCARFANCTKHIAENRYPNDNRHSKLESVGTEKESRRIRNRENHNSHWMFSSQENCTIKFGDFDRKHSVFEHSSRWTKHQIYRCCFSTYSVCLRKMNCALWNWSFVAKYSIEFPDHRKESFNKIKFIFFARIWQFQEESYTILNCLVSVIEKSNDWISVRMVVFVVVSNCVQYTVLVSVCFIKLLCKVKTNKSAAKSVVQTHEYTLNLSETEQKKSQIDKRLKFYLCDYSSALSQSTWDRCV